MIEKICFCVKPEHLEGKRDVPLCPVYILLRYLYSSEHTEASQSNVCQLLCVCVYILCK